MFPSSTQLKYWTFSGTTELTRLREETNRAYIERDGNDYEDSYRKEAFLTPHEERLVLRHYEYVLKEFCKHFQPPMPPYVLGTAIIFLKRFYLHNSIMDYHPKDMIYTCTYLACKVEEFNVSISQFVGNLHTDRNRATDVLLAQELLLMQQLRYHLTVYNCYRPLEGQLIDIKTRCPDIEEPERLRRGAEEFIDRSLNTDVCLIFSPAQISVAALLSSGSKVNISLDNYVAKTLLGTGSHETFTKATDNIKRIRFMVKNQDPLDREEVRALEVKLTKCRNPENDPDSDIYKENLKNLWDEEGDRRLAKNQRIAEEDRRRKLEMLS